MSSADDESSSAGGDTPRAIEIRDLLDRLTAMAEIDDPVRLKRIAEIRKAIEDGTYHVDAAEVARKILEDLGDSEEPLGLT